MTRQQVLRRSVAALAVASLVAGTQLASAGPAAASGYRHHGSSYSYGYGGYGPYYGSHYRRSYGHHGYRYSYRSSYYRHSGVGFGVHGHGSSGALVVGALGAGLLLGYILTRPQSRASDRTYYSRPIQASAAASAQPASPTFGYGKRVRRDCKPTTGSGLHQGRRATFGGTFCYDGDGRGYIVPGSEYLIGYAN